MRPLHVRSVWLTPASDKVPVPIISVETYGGPKDYLRLFLDLDHPTVEWGWTTHHTAVRIWEDRDGDL